MRSRQRAKQLGEVFTPPELVNKMLDLLSPDVWVDPTKTMIDPMGCGNGNFLVEVIKRKIKGGSTPLQALSTTFGIDIMQDNVEECRERMLKQAEESSGHERTEEWVGLITQNIVLGDALTYDWSMHGEKQAESLITTSKNVDCSQKSFNKRQVDIFQAGSVLVTSRSLGISIRITEQGLTVFRSCEKRGKGKIEDLHCGTELSFIRKLPSNDQSVKLTGHNLMFRLPDGREIMMHRGHVKEIEASDRIETPAGPVL